jgi:DNA-binding LacI/PurR family transcriptional regulator
MKIEDIAKLAQVSKSAVSLALNGKNGVSEETREKVLRIAQEHGYIPRTMIKVDHVDQYLRTNTKIIRFVACTNTGIVTEQYESLPFFMELMRNLDQSIRSKGYSFIISSINIDNFEEEINKLEQEQKTAGIILLGTNLTHEQIKKISYHHPLLVVLDTCYESLDVNFVVMNNVLGAYQAGQHIIDLGHKKIGYVESTSRMYNFDQRKNGFLQVLKDNQLEVHSHFSISSTIISSQDEFKQSILNNSKNLPTALFCECDYMAISVVKSLTELGIKVPEEISVVGFDNIFESQVVSPELTTIHVKKDKLALVAVEKLIQEIETNENDKMKIMIDTDLVVRNSTSTTSETNV